MMNDGEKHLLKNMSENTTPKFIAHSTGFLLHRSSLILLTFFLLLLISWRRWTSLIVDTGREMDLPLRLLRGELLYRDIHYLYPPLSPYFNSLLYRIFGIHLEVLNVAGIICSAIIVWLCYRIARRILSEREATLATIAVIVWCIFKPEGNLISPYSFSALHGMMLALGTLVVTLRYGEKRAWQEVVGAGILIGLAGITKQEFAMTAAVTWSAGVLFIHRKTWQQLLLRLLVPAVISLAIALPVYGYFLSRVGWHTLIDDCHLLYTSIPKSLLFYNSARTGLDYPFASILQMIGGAAVAIALASLITLLSFGYSTASRSEPGSPGTVPRAVASRVSATLLLTIFFSALSLAVIILWLSHGRWDGSPLRALPLALVGVMLENFFRRDEIKPQFALFVIAVYSLMALIRVVLRVPSGGAFGGYFLPTSLILIVYLTTVSLPIFIEQFYDEYTTESVPSSLSTIFIKSRLRFIGITLLSFWLLVTIAVFGYRYRKTFPVLITAPHGSLYVTQATAQATQEMLEFIAQNSAPEDAIAVVPEGSSLAFLSGRKMPLRQQIMIPGFMDAQGERDAIAQVATVKYVLVINRPMREFGLEAFGRDYYQAFGQYLDEKFHVVKVCGEVKDEKLQIGSPHFFIKILAHR